MDLVEFEGIVDQTVTELPEEFKSRLDNVDIMVEIWPTEEDLRSIFAHPGTTLFGLYRGIPKTKRGNNYSGVLPDKITIFAGPILRFSESLDDAKKQIRKTVLHEIGHYFGMSEKAIRQAQEKI
jgi:predicted Zn-dependent protease with MMP-like domain